jgi:hypothetical protein
MPGHMAEVLYSITAWAARYELQRQSELIKAGLSRVLKEGRKPGQPIGARGFQKKKT